jgi:transcriptional regulator with XRE-family HTH domain
MTSKRTKPTASGLDQPSRPARTAEDLARYKAIRERFQQEKPSLEELVSSGEYNEPLPMGEYLSIRQAVFALKKAREAAGLSLAEVAERTGIDKAALSRIETGQHPNPTVSTLCRYAHALGKRWKWVLENEAIPARDVMTGVRPSEGHMLTDLCIYTIKQSDDLRASLANGGCGTFTERKKWVRARQLLEEAKRAGKRLPVIFAPAEATRHLFAWALLDEIVPDEESAYTFSGLRLFDPQPLKATLKKASDGEPLDPWFIRPYAICQTPDYLLEQLAGSGGSETSRRFKVK